MVALKDISREKAARFILGELYDLKLDSGDSMKIEKLKLKNFAQFEDFEIVFNEDITHLIGINGSGKTTVGLNALWAGFKGIAEKSKSGALIGERFRFISEGKKSLDVEITLVDEVTQQRIKLTRHITKSTNTIKITPDKGGEIPREYVENLFNVSFLSASHFSALTGVQQAEAMGIDVSKYDCKLILQKDEAKDLRRDIKAVGTLTPVEFIEPVDVKEITALRREADEFNQIQGDRETEQIDLTQNITDCDEEIAVAMGTVNRLNQEKKTYQDQLQAAPDPEERKDVDIYDAAIEESAEINAKATAYSTYLSEQAVLNRCNGELEANAIEQKDVIDRRAEYLQSKSFGISGLSIDDSGQLTKDGKYIRPPYFSKGELEVLVARIAMNLNPELKVRFIDDFEMLDDKNQELLIRNLTKKGFQIITATVGDKPKGDNSVLLRACKIVGDSRKWPGGTITEDPGKAADFDIGTGKVFSEKKPGHKEDDQLLPDDENITPAGDDTEDDFFD